MSGKNQSFYRRLSAVINKFGFVKNKIRRSDQSGSALILALFTMLLLLGIVFIALSRTGGETAMTTNEMAEEKGYAAAEASLEIMTREFNKSFDTKLNPDAADFTRVQTRTPGTMSTDFNFVQNLSQTSANQTVILTRSDVQGLTSIRSEWLLDTTVTDVNNNAQVQLQRRFYNNLVPIFQFGIFYDNDLEFHPGPRFDFGGRVHSNGNIFLAANTGLYFSSKVTAANHILTDVGRNGDSYTRWGDNVFIRNAAGTYVQLANNMGSALNLTTNGTNVFAGNSDYPAAYDNANWNAYQSQFDKNLAAKVAILNTPIRRSNANVDYAEIIKRPKSIGDVMWNTATSSTAAVTAATADSAVIARERYANKTGIRVSLADNKEKLPGCADPTTGIAVTTQCGVNLNVPLPTNAPVAPAQFDRLVGAGANYVPTAFNKNRFTTNGTGIWIKVELVNYDATNSTIVETDVTRDFLALGITEPAPNSAGNYQLAKIDLNAATNALATNFTLVKDDPAANPLTASSKRTIYNGNLIPTTSNSYPYYDVYNNGTSLESADNLSIIKMQKFVIPGARVDCTNCNSAARSNYLYNFGFASNNSNGVVARKWTRPGVWTLTANNIDFSSNVSSPANDIDIDPSANVATGTKVTNGITNDSAKILMLNGDTTNNMYLTAPVPIKLFDTREGLYNADISTGTVYPNNQIPENGDMSLIDIDVKNLRRFLAGNFNGIMPTTTPYALATGHALRNTDVPSANGWVFYVSDRRGDRNFDGRYAGEDVYGNNDGILQPGENVYDLLPAPTTALLDSDSLEAPRYTGGGSNITAPDVAASKDTSFYRRSVRLINGTTIPGNYDSVTPANTLGFTFASENGVYVFGNYNATGVATHGSPSPTTDYLPQNTSTHIPASIVGDSVTILSNNWNDVNSFNNPFDSGARLPAETTLRFAMISGKSNSSLNSTPNQGGGDLRMCGGVHNFKRTLENWGGVYLNYTGSIINLYNSQNSNGTYKNSGAVYSPPNRNWTFDTEFLDPNRLPPGTPFLQFIEITGFQRINN